MSGYGAIAVTEDDGDKPLNLIPDGLISFVGEEHGAESHQRERPATSTESTESNKLTFKVNPEAIRFISYICFWAMCLFAIAMNNMFTRPFLLEGPEDPGSTCPPFDKVEGKIDRSMGFDVKTESHLVENFGFNNICSNWDYSPSRELTAMVYPFFEYSLLLYIILDFFLAAVSYKKGYVGARYWTAAKIIFPFQIFFCAEFRMIFVYLAYEDVRMHTAGFLGLQVALMTVAILNTCYVLQTKVAYERLGGVQGTKIAAYAYIISNLLISGIKVYLTMYVVLGLGGETTYPLWGLKPLFPWSDKVIGQYVDLVWMVFNAIIPVFISYIRANHTAEPPLEFTIDLKPRFHGE